MKSTLYLKFIFIYIVFGFLSLFTAATLTENLVSTPIFNRVSNSMYREATMVANDYLPGYFSGGLTESDAQIILSGIETQLDAAVWFVSKDGKVILSAQSGSYPSAPDSIKDFDPAESGSDRSQTGDYHGYFNNDVITVTVPVTYGYSPKGYLMIHQYTSVVDTMTDTLMRGVYITFIVIFLLSFIILLAFHFLVYRPLHKITEAATQYASGNLEYEIPVTTEDEMGYLSASLNYMSSQLRDMEDYQKKFVANVSHDFRSPLTSIKGYIEAMLDGTIPLERHEKYLGIVLNEAQRLTKLTQGLLELNNFDSFDLQLDKSNFDIRDIITPTVNTFEKRCQDRGIFLDSVFLTDNTIVYADRTKIQQVIYNLVDNAIKFTPAGRQIRVQVTEKDNKIFISVKDEGVGIPKDAQKKVFERFYKTDPSRGKDKTGTGLGLAITKEIIKAHGEQITLTSEEGKGSEFIFSLPKEKDMLVPIKPVHIESRNEGYSEADTSSPSIKSNGKFRIKDS